jgi:hypothetical protein
MVTDAARRFLMARGAALAGGRSGDGGFAMIAPDIEFEDHRVMDEPVDRGDGRCLVEEDGIPGAEWLVGGDERGSALVACGNQLEKDASLGLALLIVVDREVRLVELFDGGGESQLLAGGLQFLDEVRGSGEEHAIAVVGESVTENGPEMALARAGRDSDMAPGF